MGQKPEELSANEAAVNHELSAASLRATTALFRTVERLVWGLARDPRVRPRQRAKLRLAGAWLSCPLDALPDWLPVIGYLDDMFVAAVALNRVVSRLPLDVVAQHWPSALDYAHAADRIVSAAASVLPPWLARRVFVPRRRPAPGGQEPEGPEEAQSCPRGEQSWSR